MIITSKQNPHIKQIRQLQSRKARQETGLFLVEGIRWVIEALAQPDRVDTVVVCRELLKSATGYEALERAERQGRVQILAVDKAVFSSIASRDNPVGLAAVVRQQWERLDTILPNPPQFWIALNAVQYPGNLGTILRTADAAGAAGIILLDSATDPYDPVAVRASVNGIFTQRLVRADFASFARWREQTGYRVIGAADDAPTLYREADYRLPLVLLMGSEGGGLTQEHQQLCDQMVSIPMRGHNDSLNLAVATALIMYEVLAQQTP
jgi:TrmH family RNA methyltransferase